MVDRYRCYALYQLLPQVLGLQGDILEVGVWRGGTGALLARAAQAHTPHPPRIWLADTFAGVVKAGGNDPYYKGGEHANTSEQVVRDLLQSMHIEKYHILPGVFPEQAEVPPSQRFCFCHIDVDVYQSAKDVLLWVWPRLSHGGIVVFDDYGFYGCEGVTKLVNEQNNTGDRIFVHNLNGQALFIKTKIEEIPNS